MLYLQMKQSISRSKIRKTFLRQRTLCALKKESFPLLVATGWCLQHPKRTTLLSVHLARVVQRVDSTIHWINHDPADKCYRNQLRYPLDDDLSKGQCYPSFEQLGP